MVSSGLLRSVALVRTDVSEEPGTSFIRVTKIDEQGTTRIPIHLVFLRSVRRLLVAACVVPTDFCHPDEGGARFLRNVGSYKSHTA
jgi:hypothetical protein